MPPDKNATPAAAHRSPHAPSWVIWPLKILGYVLTAALALVVSAALLVGTALAIAYPNLPDVSELMTYTPKLPLRIYTQDGLLMGEYGEERRYLTPIAEIPQVMKNAVLAIEDSRFYQHGGVDYQGVLRAGLANLNRTKAQGASTITMQVARNIYLSSEKTYTRKIYEILLTLKLEHLLTKDQILEIYMNQIFLGNRAYGFSAAAEIYFGKALKDITVAEAAMLAGLPKAPSAYNPISNPARARARQQYIIDRMQDNGFITAAQAQQARQEPLRLRHGQDTPRVHAEYVSEMARQMVFAQYGADAYTRGLHVYTTIRAEDQMAAYRSLRRGILEFDRRQVYRGPEKFVALPAGELTEDAIDEALGDAPDGEELLPALVLQASRNAIKVARPGGQVIDLGGDALRAVSSGLNERASPNVKIRRGAVIRISQNTRGGWDATQLPEVEGAFVALDPQTGAVRALVGGFDFNKNKFNHVTQAWRQPGSSFKPFVYSSALEKGFSPATVVNDAPLFFDAGVTGGQPWEPKNYDGKFEGPMPLRTALKKSKNMVSIRILQAVTPKYTQDWITRFGFEADKHPAYLTMALGAGSVTPMQMASAYAVFANGGYRTDPHLIVKITEQKGRVLMDLPPQPRTEAQRAIPARNAFVMDTLLQEITRSGTAARAQQVLGRPDLFGKTGTTNDSIDTWFAGFQPSLVAVVWMGYDTPRSLGDKETGGGLSLPIWINFMQSTLKGVPQAGYEPPSGLVQRGSEWLYEEFALHGGVTSLGVASKPKEDADPNAQSSPSAPSEDEKKSILDLFRE